MKTLAKYLWIIPIIMLPFSCNSVQAQFVKGDKDVIKSERNLSNFNYVEIKDGIDLLLTQGTETKCVIEADQNLHQYIKTEIEGDVLKIYLTKKIFKAEKMQVNLQIIDLKGLSASGGADIMSSGLIKLGNLSAIGSGGSDITLNLEADEFKLKVSGGSDGSFSGKVNTFKAMASGGSDIKASDLVSNDCTIDVSGGSDAQVNAIKSLMVRGSGGCDVSYKGNPEKIDSNLSGGSDLLHN